MIEPETQRIQGDGKAKECCPKIHEVRGINAGACGFVFTTRLFPGRGGHRRRERHCRGKGPAQGFEEIPPKDAASRAVAELRSAWTGEAPVPTPFPKRSSLLRTPPDCAGRFPTGLWRSMACCLPSTRCRLCRDGSRAYLRRIPSGTSRRRWRLPNGFRH